MQTKPPKGVQLINTSMAAVYPYCLKEFKNCGSYVNVFEVIQQKAADFYFCVL